MSVIKLSVGENVNVHPSTSYNYVQFGDNLKIAKECIIFGSEEHTVTIGSGSILAMCTIIDGTQAEVKIGKNVSLGQQSVLVSHYNVPESSKLKKLFKIQAAPITIGDDTWTGSGCIFAPGVTVGKCCIIASNSYVDRSVPDYSIYGGNPAKLIRNIDPNDLIIE